MEDNRQPTIVDKTNYRYFKLIRGKKNNENKPKTNNGNLIKMERLKRDKPIPHIKIGLGKAKKEDPLVSDKILSEKDERYPFNDILFKKLIKTQEKTLISKENTSVKELINARCTFLRMADEWQKKLKLFKETIYFAIHLFDQNVMKIVFFNIDINKNSSSRSETRAPSQQKRKKFIQIPSDWNSKSIEYRLQYFIISLLFTACKYMEIQVLDYKDFQVYSKPIVSLLKLIEAEILELMNFRLAPTVETSIYQLIKAELDIKNENTLDMVEFKIVNGIRSGIIRRENPIYTIFGIFYREFRFKAEDYIKKMDRIAGKYKIDKRKSIKLESEFNAELRGFLTYMDGKIETYSKL